MDEIERLEGYRAKFLSQAVIATSSEDARNWMQAASTAQMMLQMRELTGGVSPRIPFPDDWPPVMKESE